MTRRTAGASCGAQAARQSDSPDANGDIFDRIARVQQFYALLDLWRIELENLVDASNTTQPPAWPGSKAPVRHEAGISAPAPKQTISEGPFMARVCRRLQGRAGCKVGV
jgi:hypothetical protein